MRDKVKKTNSQEVRIDNPLHVLGYREDGYWWAHALEVDIMAHGDTFDAALQSLKETLQVHFEGAYVDDAEGCLHRRAESKYWKLFYEASKPRLIMKGERKKEKEQDYYALVIHQPVIDPKNKTVSKRVTLLRHPDINGKKAMYPIPYDNGDETQLPEKYVAKIAKHFNLPKDLL